MKFTQVKIAEMIGVIAVVLSLVFLGQEISQSNRIALASAESEARRDSRQIYQELIQSSEGALVLSKLRERSTDLSPTEFELADLFVRFQLSTWSATNEAFLNGMLSEASYNTYLSLPGDILKRYPGTIEIFVSILESNARFACGRSKLLDTVYSELRNTGNPIGDCIR